MRRRSLVVLIGSAIAVLAVVIASIATRAPDVRVTTAPVTQGPIARQIFATGTLEPTTTVNVGSQVSGTIAEIDADFNSHVRAGQVIARLDPAAHRARLVEAQAGLAQAQAEYARLQAILEDARTKLARADELRTDDLIPQTDLDTARVTSRQAAAEAKASLAAIAAARALVTEAEVNLEHTIIRSPIDGIVVNRAVDVGQTIAASIQTPVLFTIADLRRMQLLTEINEADVATVRAGTPLTFQIESVGDRWFDGTVADVRLQPVVEQAVASNTTGSTPAPSPATSSPTPVGTAGTAAASATASSGGSAATGTGTTQSNSGSTSSTTSAAANTGSSTTSSASSTAGSGAVNYVAVVDINNVDGRLAPGGTAIVTLTGAERANVVRIPNAATTFSPGAHVLEVLGQTPPSLDALHRSDDERAGTRRGYVWKFEDGRLVPVLVTLGLADDRWTELLEGPLHAGDTLVTNAAPR
jgi:RND family efflux transporter MFP subunit